ncbi:hypothetical protein [Cupriavidus sp. D39]|uniref:hypothetical protein n=1 Tax=Cupriavidus sp. D39 TaxID=2997877 RepID=UPI00226FDE61|nr:hypothetical protein [Cupriavidus sp. D39]MCY0854317.1 hypothetical protein [Cupriavidus sp. D39]
MSDTKLDLDALEREAEAMRSFSAWRIIARLIARIRELESRPDTRAMGASAVTDEVIRQVFIAAGEPRPKQCHIDAARALLAAQPSEDKRSEAVCIKELFERQAAGFARAFEALGIDADDDRERSWSSLVLAIRAAIAKGEGK